MYKRQALQGGGPGWHRSNHSGGNLCDKGRQNLPGPVGNLGRGADPGTLQEMCIRDRIATCLVVAGAGFLGVGYALGGSPSFAIGPEGIVNGTTSVNHSLEKTRIDAFENVKLTVNFGDITIVPSDGYYLEYSLTGDEKGPAYSCLLYTSRCV